MTVVWVSWTFQKRKQPVLRIRNTKGHCFFKPCVYEWKGKCSNFSLSFVPPELMAAVELPGVECLLSQTKQASIQLCHLLAGLSCRDRLFNLFFYSTSIWFHLQRAWAWLLAFSWTVYKTPKEESSQLDWPLKYLICSSLLKSLFAFSPISHLQNMEVLQTFYSSCFVNEWREENCLLFVWSLLFTFEICKVEYLTQKGVFTRALRCSMRMPPLLYTDPLGIRG